MSETVIHREPDSVARQRRAQTAARQIARREKLAADSRRAFEMQVRELRAIAADAPDWLVGNMAEQLGKLIPKYRGLRERVERRLASIRGAA